MQILEQTQSAAGDAAGNAFTPVTGFCKASLDSVHRLFEILGLRYRYVASPRLWSMARAELSPLLASQLREHGGHIQESAKQQSKSTHLIVNGLSASAQEALPKNTRLVCLGANLRASAQRWLVFQTQYTTTVAYGPSLFVTVDQSPQSEAALAATLATQTPRPKEIISCGTQHGFAAELSATLSATYVHTVLSAAHLHLLPKGRLNPNAAQPNAFEARALVKGLVSGLKGSSYLLYLIPVAIAAAGLVLILLASRPVNVAPAPPIGNLQAPTTDYTSPLMQQLNRIIQEISRLQTSPLEVLLISDATSPSGQQRKAATGAARVAIQLDFAPATLSNEQRSASGGPSPTTEAKLREMLGKQPGLEGLRISSSTADSVTFTLPLSMPGNPNAALVDALAREHAVVAEWSQESNRWEVFAQSQPATRVLEFLDTFILRSSAVASSTDAPSKNAPSTNGPSTISQIELLRAADGLITLRVVGRAP